jgi:hypothetical protein
LSVVSHEFWQLGLTATACVDAYAVLGGQGGSAAHSIHDADIVALSGAHRFHPYWREPPNVPKGAISSREATLGVARGSADIMKLLPTVHDRKRQHMCAAFAGRTTTFRF